MYAVIEAGGKQHKVELGQVLEVDLMQEESGTDYAFENVMLFVDGDDVQMPQKAGLEAIGGIVHHLQALTAIGCSTVNSYRRLWDTGFWAPVFADWSFQNRTTGLRVSAPGRFEFRSVDSMVNPYLMGSTILAAADDGIVNKLDPG